MFIQITLLSYGNYLGISLLYISICQLQTYYERV